MAAFWSNSTVTLREGGWISITTTSATSCTNMVTYTNGVRYVPLYEAPAEPPPATPEYLKLRPVVLYRDCRKAQRVVNVDAPQPRGRLARWKSLKEKRQAWIA